MNQITLIGNLTNNPESGKTTSGVQYCRFSLAVNRAYKDANGNRETDFFPVVVWRGLAELCFKYLAKGKKIALSGQMQIGSYEKDGKKQTTFEVVGEDVEFLTKKEGSTSEPNEQ